MRHTNGPENTTSQKTISRSDLIAIRTTPTGFKKIGGGGPMIQTKPFIKIPISDLYNVPTSAKVNKVEDQDAYGFDDLEIKQSKVKEKHFLDASSGNTEEEI